MSVLPNAVLYRCFTCVGPFIMGVVVLLGTGGCTSNFPAKDTKPVTPPQSTTPVSASATAPVGSTTTTPGSTTPISATAVPPVLVDTLPGVAPPRFAPNGGNVYIGTSVKLMADSLPPQAVVEYSVDGGQQWKAGQQFPLMEGGQLLTRIRLGTTTTRSRSALFNLYFNRVLIIGNSIMSHAPDPSIGWRNFNGMAASAPEKDFVHILTQRLRASQPAVEIKLLSGGGFERNYASMNLADWNQSLRFAPDLVIIRIAENITEGDVGRLNLDTYYRDMLSKVVSNSPTVKVVCSTSFWYHPVTDAIIRKAASERGFAVADLSQLVGRPEYRASQYANSGVAAHPNDAGMQQIANILWEAIQ